MAHVTSQRLIGKVAIVTGGASGFGEATARLFIKHGAKVVIADIQDDKGQSLCSEINAQNIGEEEVISYVNCNVTIESDVENLIKFTISKHGKLDIMYNNAGILGDKSYTILGSTLEDFQRVFDTNVCGGFLGAKHAAKVMIPRNTGVILFTSSAASVVAGCTSHAYTVSKHASVGLMKNLAVELGEYGIRVNAISPGVVTTPMVTNSMRMEERSINEMIGEVSVLKGVIPQANDVANAALYLVSDESKFVSGLNLILDGAFAITNTSFTTYFNNLRG